MEGPTEEAEAPRTVEVVDDQPQAPVRRRPKRWDARSHTVDVAEGRGDPLAPVRTLLQASPTLPDGCRLPTRRSQLQVPVQIQNDGLAQQLALAARRPQPTGGPQLGLTRATGGNQGGVHDTLDAELGRNLAAVNHLEEELNGLLAEMGRQVTTVRSGQRSELRLAAGVARTIEVKLPKAPQENTVEWVVQLDCSLDRRYHAVEKGDDQQALLPVTPFDMGVADTQRQASEGGPWRAQSLSSSAHRLRFGTDCKTVFVNLLSHYTCHVELVCKVHQEADLVGHAATAVEGNRTDGAESADSGENPGRPWLSRSVGGAGQRLRLQAKLHRRRQERVFEETSSPRKASPPPSALVEAASSPSPIPMSSSPSAAAAMKAPPKPRSLAEYLFQDEVKANGHWDEVQLMQATRRALELWLGYGNRFFSAPRGRRARGMWVLRLSADCPRKLIRWLKKAVQDRHALSCVAAVGAAAFLFKRWRELHLARARAAVRQLVWYKTLFAASRFRFTMVFVVEGREARRRIRDAEFEKVAAPPEKRRADTNKERGRGTRGARHSLLPFGFGGGGGSVSISAEEAILAQVTRCEEKISSARGSRIAAEKRRAAQTAAALEDRSASPEGQGGQRDVTTAGSGAGSLTAPRSRGPRLELPRYAHVGETIQHGMHEMHLQTQGFVISPRLRGAGAVVADVPASGTASAFNRPSVSTRKAAMTKELTETLGRPVQLEAPPPAIGLGDDSLAPIGADDAQRVQAALKEASSRMVRVTVRPDELPHASRVCGGRAQRMGVERFEQFERQTQQRCAEALLKRYAAQAELERGQRRDVVKITKRYLLTFFEEDPPDLPALPLLQNLMLVVHGVAVFQLPQERQTFEAKLRVLNEARKAAMKRPGILAPLEAAMWAHPVIVQLAARLQKVASHGDTPTAWKGTLFEGSYEDCSDRDALGLCLHSAKPIGGPALAVQRRLVDISGAFTVAINCSPPIPSIELMPSQPYCLATRTPNGALIRPFAAPEAAEAVFRQSDPLQEVARATEPKDLRIEELRQKRRARSSRENLGAPTGTPQLLRNTEQKARQRYGDWVMRTDVPEKVRAAKAQMLDFFEDFISTAEASLESSKQAMSSVSQMDSLASMSMELEMESSTYLPSLPSLQLGSSSPQQKPGGGSAANSGKTGPPATTRAGRGASGGITVPPPIRPRDSATMALPRTVEEVGKLVAQSDALKSILSIDQGERGGFARRCAAGWKSGYREEPMSEDELRRALLLHRPSGPGPGGGGVRVVAAGVLGRSAGPHSAR